MSSDWEPTSTSKMRLRGLSGARDEFHLAAIVQNLKTMALRILGTPPQQVRALLA
jgi:hypothetical protein